MEKVFESTKIENENDYHDFIKSYSGHYPVSLRTDGHGIFTEPGLKPYDEYKPDGIGITTINSRWPDYKTVIAVVKKAARFESVSEYYESEQKKLADESRKRNIELFGEDYE